MNEKIFFWSELLKFKFLKPVIPKLNSYNIGLNLAITPKRLLKVGEIVKQCEKNDVELNFWPLLSEKQGYYINRWNFKVQAKWIDYLLENFPIVNSYLLDLETPLNFGGLKGIILNSKLNKLVPDDEAKKKLESIVNNIHDHGKRAVSTSKGGIPPGMEPRPSNADYYSYMVYLSYIKRFSDNETRENIIYYCAKKIRKEHGQDKAAIDIGITNYGIQLVGLTNFLGYLDLEELVKQIEVCLYSKLKRIHIFSLDNMTKEIDKWLENISSAKPKKPPLFRSEKRGLMYKAYKKFLFAQNLSIF
jgi:hypothetical protein